MHTYFLGLRLHVAGLFGAFLLPLLCLNFSFNFFEVVEMSEIKEYV